ncbi:MAG: glycosyltransferase, partial [Pseudomonadota bacterium]
MIGKHTKARGSLPSPAAEASVIIPHYNDTLRLHRCLVALLANSGIEAAEIVVVDNGSSESLAHLYTAFPTVRFVEELKPGAAAARNRGVLVTKSPRLLFLDADCVPDPSWYTNAVHSLKGRDIVGGAISVFDENPAPRTGAQAFEAVFAFDQKSYIEEKGFSVTANLATWRLVFDRVGPFRAHVPEDLDWCRRATAMGYSVAYEPYMQLSHPSRADWPALAKKWRRLTTEAAGLALNRPGGRVKWLCRAVAVVGSIGRDAKKVLSSPQLADG